jgi:FkbM family methyltransferase
MARPLIGDHVMTPAERQRRRRAKLAEIVHAGDVLDHRLACVHSPRTVETRYGPLVVPEGGDELIVRFLNEMGEWAWDEAVFVSSLLSDGARVLDGGAFIGTFGLGLGLNTRLGLLCAIEANEAILPFLDANLKRNAKARKAISLSTLLIGPDAAPRPGFAVASNLGSVSYASDASGDALPPPISTITLAALRDRYGDFDLIKLDIEGMEHEVLLADAAQLSRGRTTLCIECNENVRSLQILDLLLSWGVAVHYFAFPSHNPDNYRGLADPILPWSYEAGLLVSPRTKPALTPGLAAHHCILRSISLRADLEEAMWITPRWLPCELSHAGPSELAAAASRAIRGQARENFLADAGRAGPQTVWERLTATQTGLAQAQELAIARLVELEEGRRLRAAVEAGLAQAQELAIARLVELEEERKLRAAVEAGLAQAQELAIARPVELEEERKLRAALEAGLAQAQELAIARLVELEEERKLRAAVEAGLAQAQELAIARSVELEEERKLRAIVEADLVQAQELAITRLDMLEREVRLRAAAEMRIANTASMALGRLQQVGEQRERAAAAETRVMELECALHDATGETAQERNRASSAEARALKLERDLHDATAETAKERDQASSAETRALELERALHDATAEKAKERDRASAAETHATDLERTEQATASKLAAIRSSLAWRLITPIHNFVGQRPRLHGTLRRGRAVVGDWLGRRR